jgi:hypothetical protein
MSYITAWVVLAIIALLKRGCTKLSEIESEVQEIDKLRT